MTVANRKLDRDVVIDLSTVRGRALARKYGFEVPRRKTGPVPGDSKTPPPLWSCEQCSSPFRAYTSSRRRFCSYQCHLDSGGALRAGLAASRATMKYGPKKDANHNELVAAMESLGLCVYDVSGLGRGLPDCLVWVRGEWQLVEIKNPKTGYGRRGLNSIQKRWIGQWRGGPVFIVRTTEDVANLACGAMDKLDSTRGAGA